MLPEQTLKDQIVPFSVCLVIVRQHAYKEDQVSFHLQSNNTANQNLTMEQQLTKRALELAQSLRNNGIIVHYQEKGNTTKQMANATKRNASVCVILGEDEMQQNKIIVKHLQSSTQQTYAQEQLLSVLLAMKNTKVD